MDTSTSRFVGRLDLPIVGFNGYPVGTLEVVLRLDTVTVWLASKCLAVMDRDAFAGWMSRPLPPFDVDDLRWTSEGADLLVGIGRATPYVLPDWFADRLRDSI